jgi:hypothetical protein
VQRVIPRHITALPAESALRCVAGVMAHPEDPQRASECISWGLALAALEQQDQDEPIALPRDVVRGLVSGAERGVGNDFDNAITPGCMAGGVLLSFLQAQATEGVEDFSVDKGQYTVSRAMQPILRTGAGESTVRANWSRFKSVAHLWAAYLWVLEKQGDQPQQLIAFHEHAQDFLCMAKGLLIAASKCRLHGGGFLLERGKCWDFEGVEPVEIRVGPLGAEELRALPGFRSRKR